MRIDHIALYTRDLEGLRAFYERYFDAHAGERYRNNVTGLETYFLTLEGSVRLELMTRPDVATPKGAGAHAGYTHMAIGVGSRADVDALTARLQADGYKVATPPRLTGDGYYESCVLDPDGNRIELTADEM
nr:VOC family protein [Maliibacterium massiliense]